MVAAGARIKQRWAAKVLGYETDVSEDSDAILAPIELVDLSEVPGMGLGGALSGAPPPPLGQAIAPTSPASPPPGELPKAPPSSPRGALERPLDSQDVVPAESPRDEQLAGDTPPALPAGATVPTRPGVAPV